MKGTILIIDDEEQLRGLLSRIIRLEGFAVHEASSLKGADKWLRGAQADIILCDVKLPDGNGVDYVASLRPRFPLTEVILLTAYGNIPDGVQAIKNGAFDYITKGNDNDRIVPLLYQAMDRVNGLKRSAVRIREKGHYDFGDILGSSPLISKAISLARKIAPTDTTVLLLGETGTGKEVFAGAIHNNSRRSRHPFIAINCSAFTRELLEGELFGHKEGAYTGATKDKKGLIELADGGTLFLDEIGEMNIELQAKLLRVLENGSFIKLGDVKTTTADVRFIAATNRDLAKEVAQGQFREDLFYRLDVFRIALPALRERTEDIAALSSYFLQQHAGREHLQPMHLDREALRLLQQHAWRGNIRELRNVLERAVILAEGDTILPGHLPYEVQNQNGQGPAGLSLASLEKAHIQKILLYAKGNKTRTAEILGIGLTTLYRKMEEYGIPKI